MVFSVATLTFKFDKNSEIMFAREVVVEGLCERLQRCVQTIRLTGVPEKLLHQHCDCVPSES